MHTRGGGMINDADTLKTGRHLAAILSLWALGQTVMLWRVGIRPNASPGFSTEPLARWGLSRGGDHGMRRECRLYQLLKRMMDSMLVCKRVHFPY